MLQKLTDTRHRQLAERFFELFPEFPRFPYLLIDSDERSKRCAALDELRSHLAVCLLPTTLATAEDVDRYRSSNELLLVDRHSSLKDILMAYRRIQGAGRKGKRRGSLALKELGATRLYIYFKNWEKALAHADKYRTPDGITPQYPNESQWRRAKSSCLKRIDSVVENLMQG